MATSSNPEVELQQIRQRLFDSEAAFAALASGQVDSIAWPTGPVLVRQAQEALVKSEQKFRSLIEQLPNLVWVHRRGRLVFANPHTVRSIGCEDPSEIIGRELSHWVVRVPKGDPKLNSYEVQLTQRSGALLAIEVTDQGVIFDGEPATLTVGLDVTERRRLEAQLLIADRMSSVGMLAAGVAHEINNPLAFVIANLEFVAAKLEVYEQAHPDQAFALLETSSALSEARSGAERVRIIVRDLKGFSTPDDGRRGVVNVASMLEATVNMAAHEIRQRAHLIKDYGPEPLLVDGNESRLAQVFLNLLMNAAQAVPEGAADENVIRLSARREGDGRVRIEVRDSGQGMTPEVKARLFTPFFSTKPKGLGTGLGLSISQKIVAAHAGEIQVESLPGRGTTVRVLLPSAVSPPLAALTPPTALPAKGRRGRVLIVDDEVMIGTSLRRLLIFDHDIEVETSAKAALSRLAKDDGYDVVLCDMMMPDMTGAQLYQAVEASNPALARRFVFLTGGAFTPMTKAFLEGMTNPVLEKPIEAAHLRTVVAGLVARSPVRAATH